MPDYQFTIIVPVFNEIDGLAALEARLAAYVPVCPLRACVLLVDDGSTDGSSAAICAMCRRQPHFFHIRLARNSGPSAVMKVAFRAARTPWLGYIDADLQTAPEDFDLLLAARAGHDLVAGIRAKRNDTWARRWQSRVGNAFRRAMTGDGALDTACPLKVLRAEAARRLPIFTGMHRFLPALILLQGGAYVQLPVRHFPRTTGTAKFGLRNRLVGPLFDCLALRWMRRRNICCAVAEDDYSVAEGGCAEDNA